MLYFIIPLSVCVAASLAVLVIVWRKMPYLKKLTPESHEFGDTVLHDFAPEAIDWVRGIPWRRALHNALVETEKLLRRMRLGMSSLDRLSDRVIHRVRRVHQKTAKRHEEQVAKLQHDKEERVVEPDPDAVDFDDPERLKLEEQRLIVAIAQQPKQADLYSDLARISLHLGNYGDAVEAMEQAVKLEPDSERYKKQLERARKRLEQKSQS